MERSMDKDVEYELVYDGSAAKVIVERFPDATIEDARDDVHRDRIVVKIPGTSIKEFYQHALEEGYCLCILGFQMMLYLKKEEAPEFHKLCDDFIATKIDTEEG